MLSVGRFLLPYFYFLIFPFAADEPLTLLLRWAFCQDRNMKQFCVSCLFPMLLTAQTAQLTEQLGKTVLYEDIALSPDGASRMGAVHRRNNVKADLCSWNNQK
jgi:hypothetical protein